MGISLGRSFSLQYKFLDLFLTLYWPPVLRLRLHFHMLFSPLKTQGHSGRFNVGFLPVSQELKAKNHLQFVLAAYDSIFK